MNNMDIITQLQRLGLLRDEASLYLELLKGPSSHLQLSRATGINRTKVYRLAEQLQKRSLIHSQTDDTGTFLVASDPSVLEVALTVQEEKLKTQRSTFTELLPDLLDIKLASSSPLNFRVRTYEGEEGFRQMLWHELKSRPEALIFGSGTIEDLVPNPQWAEKLRQRTIDAGYTIREVLNPKGKKPVFTFHQDFMHRYTKRYINPAVLPLQHQVVIYNDTVSTYCWRDDQKVGFEVVNSAYANFMRASFEHFWQIGLKTEEEAEATP